MALTNAQIISLACQIAKCPNFTSQAGQLYNAILSDLCQTYDFDAARLTLAFNLPGGINVPYALPADYLRAAENEMFYTIQGVPYTLISMDLSEYDALVQTAGFSSFPTAFATDMSVAPPNMYFWPPSNGAYPATLRYYRQMADIVTPETSNAAPWFKNSEYLKRRLAGELCLLTGDDRADSFLSSNEEMHPLGAGVILRRFLTMQGDPEGRAKTVALDRRRFGGSFNGLKNTKLVGF